MKTSDSVVEEVFYAIYLGSPEQGGLFVGWWESLQLPVTPCFGEINRIDLPQIFSFGFNPNRWNVRLLAHA